MLVRRVGPVMAPGLLNVNKLSIFKTFRVIFLKEGLLFWRNLGLLFWKSGAEPSELFKVWLTCTVRWVRIRSVCRQTQSNVQSIQMADLHSFDLMWPGQSLTDMCTGSCVLMSHVGRQTESNINSFEWRKWSNSDLFELSLLPYSFSYRFHSSLKWVKRLWPTNLVLTSVLSFTVTEILEF